MRKEGIWKNGNASVNGSEIAHGGSRWTSQVQAEVVGNRHRSALHPNPATEHHGRFSTASISPPRLAFGLASCTCTGLWSCRTGAVFVAGLTLSPPSMRSRQGNPETKVSRVSTLHGRAKDFANKVIQPQAPHRKNTHQPLSCCANLPLLFGSLGLSCERPAVPGFLTKSPTCPLSFQNSFVPLSSSWVAAKRARQPSTLTRARLSTRATSSAIALGG